MVFFKCMVLLLVAANCVRAGEIIINNYLREDMSLTVHCVQSGVDHGSRVVANMEAYKVTGGNLSGTRCGLSWKRNEEHRLEFDAGSGGEWFGKNEGLFKLVDGAQQFQAPWA